MALNVNTLQTALYNVFSSMGENATELDFAKGISENVVTFVKGGTVNTEDSGVVPTGDYTGKGVGNISVTAVNCQSIILNACNVMKTKTEGGDDYLAEEIGKGLKRMADEATISTTVTGTLTPPSSSPITPYVGSAVGTISCNESSLVTALKKIFSDMYKNKDSDSYNGNLYLSQRLATEINSFWTSGKVSTQGINDLAGSYGQGNIS